MYSVRNDVSVWYRLYNIGTGTYDDPPYIIKVPHLRVIHLGKTKIYKMGMTLLIMRTAYDMYGVAAC